MRCRIYSKSQKLVSAIKLIIGIFTTCRRRRHERTFRAHPVSKIEFCRFSGCIESASERTDRWHTRPPIFPRTGKFGLSSTTRTSVARTGLRTCGDCIDDRVGSRPGQAAATRADSGRPSRERQFPQRQDVLTLVLLPRFAPRRTRPPQCLGDLRVRAGQAARPRDRADTVIDTPRWAASRLSRSGADECR